MIEVGEYVRTKQGEIAKIVDTNMFDKTIYKDIQGAKYYLEDIVNHSKNIIDLIEVGDYVNGYRILEKTKIKNNEMQICILKDNNCSNWRTVNDKTLKSIVTKEQFASMEYKVKEE